MSPRLRHTLAALFLVAHRGKASDAVTSRGAYQDAAKLARTPPMGWMSWEIFRCDVDCDHDPEGCISETLYKAQADAMVSGGFAAAGYRSIHMDDCWEQKEPPRDPVTGRLRADPKRFPSGMKALGGYFHARNLSFAAYTAESPTTCGGYPASANHEEIDAKTFAEWGVDYMKVDGCGPATYYEHGYAAMGSALQRSGRQIVYSCSWPAYTGENESAKPFQTYIDDGCNLWRNYQDIQCSWESLGDIIKHWGDYGEALQPWAGPDGPFGGHWHDMDMLLIGGRKADGSPCVSLDEERTQMAIWAISASPLIMGNDMRNVTAESKAILFNSDAIAVSQDRLGKMGRRLTDDTPTQVWAREISPSPEHTRRAAVALYHRGGPPPVPLTGECPDWSHTRGGYLETCDGDSVGSFKNLTVTEAKRECCLNAACAGFSVSIPRHDTRGSGRFHGNVRCGVIKSASYDGYSKAPHLLPPSPTAATDITLNFSSVPGFSADLPTAVLNIWTGSRSTGLVGQYTAKAVPVHGTAFIVIEQ